MSIAAMTWAFALRIKPATAKFVLVALADNADDEGRAFPSVELLVAKTCQDRKTVIRALDELEALGLLHDTGKRTGRTGQVKVYRLVGFRSNGTGHGTASAEEARVPPLPGKGAVPPAKGTVLPSEDSQKRDTEPSGNRQREPSGNRQSARARARDARAHRLPEGFELTAERRAIAIEEHLDPERTFAKFCDHWRAASGARARKLDWDAAWRNWCRTETDRARGNGFARSSSLAVPALKSAAEREAEALARGEDVWGVTR